MSAEKEIVNYWYNKKGLFTINNIKTNNKDLGILAINPKSQEVFHVQVICSLTGTIDSKEMGISAEKISEEKFYDNSILEVVQKNISSIENPAIRRVLVLGSLPKSKKAGIIKEFGIMDIQIMEFENILYDVMENLDTQYYKNDIIRTLQLTKFLLLSEPAKMAKLLVNDSFTSNSRKEFLSNILSNDEIVKEFRKTNVDRLAAILKNSGLKAAEMAEMLEHNVLNKKTRKLFLNSLMEQENMRKLTKPKKARKLETTLGKFF
ncbi:hypothetical protein J4448_02635 [Candidatus Woesearchaeota archaeon]|nr:hypothetical protein [Candidatus Woesearchaeota archaeon]